MVTTFRQEADGSKLATRTTIPFREFAFSVVLRALISQYGDNISDRCFQSAVGTQLVHEQFGISAKIWSGAFCAAKVSVEPVDVGWAGFWDQDRHVWAYNEFNEIVDLTVCMLHRHPRSTTRDLPMPAIWWDEIDVWPHILLYMPDATPVAEFDDAETAQLEAYKRNIVEIVQAEADYEVEDLSSYLPPILHGPDGLEKLAEAGNAWLGYSFQLNETHAPRPPWVENRIRELTEQAMRMRG